MKACLVVFQAARQVFCLQHSYTPKSAVEDVDLSLNVPLRYLGKMSEIRTALMNGQ